MKKDEGYYEELFEREREEEKLRKLSEGNYSGIGLPFVSKFTFNKKGNITRYQELYPNNPK